MELAPVKGFPLKEGPLTRGVTFYLGINPVGGICLGKPWSGGKKRSNFWVCGPNWFTFFGNGAGFFDDLRG